MQTRWLYYLIFCKEQRYKLFKGVAAFFEKRLLKVNESPDPSNIIWENLNYNMLNKFIRRFISFVVTIALLIITLSSVVYLTAQ